jgi:hypothetical protein
MGLSARLLVSGDEERVDAFLEPHTPFAFFMRSNLKKGGVRYEGKPYQSDYFGVFDSGSLVGVLTHSWISSIQLFADAHSFIPPLAEALRKHRAKQPREIECFLGPADQVTFLLSSLGIAPSALREEENKDGEWLFSLALENMTSPAILKKPGITVRRACQADVDLLTVWRHDFNVESRGFAPGQITLDKAQEEISRRINDSELFILEDRGERVSFCGVGGFLSDWSCVGPVWTPPEKRNLGYARAITAGALQIMHGEGTINAVLFAHRPDAVRPYRAIGFERIGDWLLEDLVTTVDRL